MATGIYTTTDPNVRVRVVQDNDFADDDGFDPGVRADLIEAYDNGEAYGVIVEKREMWARVVEGVDGSPTLHDPRYEWVEDDSIWSCVGYEDVAKEVAQEFFGLTVTGKA